MSMRIYISILLIFILTVLSKAQNISTCLSEAQLLNLQTLSYNGINNYLINEGWSRNIDNLNQTNKYFGYDLEYSVVVWEKRTTEYFEGKLYLYYKDSEPNLIVYQVLNDCYGNLINLQPKNNQKKTKNIDFTSISSLKNNGIIIDFREYRNDNSSLRFSILIYNESSLNEQIQIEKDIIAAEIARRKTEEEAKRKAESDRTSSITSALISGHSLSEMGKYSEAILQYETAKKYLIEEEKSLLKEIETEIQICLKNKNRIIIENKIKEGDNFYKQKNFDAALINFEYALSFYNTNPTNFDPAHKIDTEIKDKITSTKDNVAVLVLQRTYQSYLSFNPSGFNAFRSQNFNSISSMISDLKGSGNVSYKAVIKFDIQGNNKSYIMIDSGSSKKINLYINSIRISDLTSIRKLEYYIPTIEELPFKISWNTYNLRAYYGASKIRIVPSEKLTSDFTYNIGKFVNQQKYFNGIYKFEVVEKKINGRTFNDLSLIKYKYNSGPLNSAYSLVLPGWGTLKVTDGQKGKGRTILFFLSAAISTGSKIYSSIEYDKYKKANIPGDAETHYNTANLTNKVFLLSGGIATFIYIHDFVWVFGKGIKNNNQSK